MPIHSSDFEFDEAFVAPPVAPGVPDFPVVLVSIGVRIGCWAVGGVPLVNLALGRFRARSVADNDDGMVVVG